MVGHAFESWLLLIRGSQTRGEALISLCKVSSMVLRRRHLINWDAKSLDYRRALRGGLRKWESLLLHFQNCDIFEFK